MPIYLPAPRHRPGGPDGGGWNRLSIGPHTLSDQCALRPTSYPTLFESLDTRRARWGGFDRCHAGRGCVGCPVFAAARTPRRTLAAAADAVLVRVRDVPVTPPTALIAASVQVPYVMDDPDCGWDTGADQWSWHDLRTVPGWTLGRRRHDEHGEGFWLHRVRPVTRES